ncbi:MAG: phosphoribosylformylglycinamidine synthase I [Marinilabiliales bacterium]|nr:MAG: phosphoribosylformylglycinamidine synthase I [Marinilabiliales bacterium]
MKFGVVIFPGSNCDQDMIYVLRNIMQQEVVELWHKDTDLQDVEAIVLPGGFSYGDYLRSGAIARYSPIMEKVIEFANDGGFVFGVCNGFQILCESGLLPGALLHNDNQKFICKNIYIVPDNNTNALTAVLDKQKALKIPIAHGEGRYFAKKETLQEMRQNGQILFRYCNEHGEITADANPNGSVENIAGVCNASKNVFGMMPHPERAADDELGNTDGRLIFESMISILATN